MLSSYFLVSSIFPDGTTWYTTVALSAYITSGSLCDLPTNIQLSSTTVFYISLAPSHHSVNMVSLNGNWALVSVENFDAYQKAIGESTNILYLIIYLEACWLVGYIVGVDLQGEQRMRICN